MPIHDLVTRSRKGQLALILVVVLLSACGSTGRFREANKLFENGDYVPAVQAYRDVAEANPTDVRYQQGYLLKQREALNRIFEKAESARRTGDLAQAEKWYQVALQVDPGDDQANEWLRRLGAMRRHNEQLINADELITKGDLEIAEQVVRQVLAEEPDNARARNSLDRINAEKASQAHRVTDGLDGKFKKPVTIEFRDVPMRVAFDVLSKASGINFVYDQEIRPDLKVTVFLRKIPLDEAIRAICLSTQLDSRVLNANSVLIYPNTPQKTAEYKQLSIRSFYLANADAKKVADNLKAILKIENVIVDEKLNMIVMRDTPEAIRLAEKLIALQDIGEPEVVLDVEVLEMKHTTLLDMGVSLPSEIGVSAVAPTQTSGALTVNQFRGLNSSNIYVTVPSATIKLHDEGSDAKILANPKIRVKSREKASILIGDKVPVITSTSTSTGFVAETVSYVDVGLKLEVEPSVFMGDEVSMKVNLEVSNLVREIVSRSGTLSYQIGTRNAQTVLRLKDGETQILAGLINREDRAVSSGWPGLSHFPILGRLFGTKKNDRQDTEIVLSITPHLVRGIPRASLDALEFDSGTANRLSGSPMAGASSAEAEPSTDATDDAGSESSPASTTAPANAPVGPGSPPAVQLDWSAPPEVRVGEQFTAILNINASQPIDQVAAMIGYDTQKLQVISVEQGPFLAQGGGQSSLTKQVNPADGKIMATAVRQGTVVTGQGALLQVTFKALLAVDKTTIKLLSATPNPASGGPATLADISVKIR